MITVKCHYSNGDTITTNINLTFHEAKAYYLNQTFNIGSVSDNMQECVHIELLNSEGVLI